MSENEFQELLKKTKKWRYVGDEEQNRFGFFEESELREWFRIGGEAEVFYQMGLREEEMHEDDLSIPGESFRRAAELGHAQSQLILGEYYLNSWGGDSFLLPTEEESNREAMKWFLLAAVGLRSTADQGDAVAQYSLGHMHDLGEGVPQNYEEAVKWYRLAADQGHAYAQYYLGLRHHFGQGVPQNFVEAYKWLDLALSRGVEGAKESRDIVSQKMTPEEIREAQTLARQWKPKA